VRKIKHPRVLLKTSIHPSGLKRIAKAAEIDRISMKVGFKQIYGNNVYGFFK